MASADHTITPRATDAPIIESVRARSRATPNASAPASTNDADAPAPVRSWLGPYAMHPRHWRDRQVAFVLLCCVALFYLGLYHPYWARGGDSELYLTIARNLVRGRGYTYNGQPVALVPPLWPIVLAAGMWFTSVVAILKLTMPALFLAYAGCAYFVLRRIASPWIAAASVALTTSLYGLFILTMWFHSDALFFALSWGALLLALQSSEHYAAAPRDRRPWLWRALAATLLLMAAVATRWPGVLWWPIIATAFLHGRTLLTRRDGRSLTLTLWPKRLDAMWLAVLLSAVCITITFFGLRYLLKVDAGDVHPRYDAFVTGHYDLVNQHDRPTVGTHIHRLLRAPEWLSLLYWSEPARTPGFALFFSRLAAVTAVPLMVAGLVGLARRQWIWLGVAAAWIPIVATWPHPIDRYSGPVAPMLVCGTILGTIWLSRYLDARYAHRQRWRPAMRRLPYLVMAVPLLVCLSYNLTRYGLEVWARLDFFPRYEGGIQPSLNRIAAYIRQNQPVTGGEVAVTRTGVRAGSGEADEEARYQKVRGVQRNLVFLMNHPSMDVPALESFDVHDPWFLAWAAENRVRYFVVMPRHRRFFVHLRDLPGWAQSAIRMVLPNLADYPPLSPQEIEAENYILYEVIGGELGLPVAVRQVIVTQWPQEILVIPGLEDVANTGPKRAALPLPYN